VTTSSFPPVLDFIPFYLSFVSFFGFPSLCLFRSWQLRGLVRTGTPYTRTQLSRARFPLVLRSSFFPASDSPPPLPFFMTSSKQKSEQFLTSFFPPQSPQSSFFTSSSFYTRWFGARPFYRKGLVPYDRETFFLVHFCRSFPPFLSSFLFPFPIPPGTFELWFRFFSLV